MRPIPGESECVSLLEEAGCSEKVIRHCCVVMLVSMVIAKKAGADSELVRGGALLHDIGRSRTHGIRHVVASVEILRSLDMPDELVRLVQRHVGAGLDKEEVERLGLPPGVYMPETIEEMIVCHADNLVDGSRIISFEDALEDFESKGLDSSSLRMKEMEKEISRLTGMDTDRLLRDSKPMSVLRGPCSEYVYPR